MRVEDACVFRADRFGDAFLHLENLGARLDKRSLEPPNLIRDVPCLNAMPRDLIAIVAHNMDRSAGKAGGNPDALESRLLPHVIATHAAARVARMSRSDKALKRLLPQPCNT